MTGRVTKIYRFTESKQQRLKLFANRVLVNAPLSCFSEIISRESRFGSALRRNELEKSEWNRGNLSPLVLFPYGKSIRGVYFFGGKMFEQIKYDINAIKSRDPAARNSAEVFFLYPGFKAVFWYRIAHKLYKNKHFFLARWISQRVRNKTGIEIHPGATIGKGLFIDHGGAVVIGETAEIGDDCTIYQGVTLGGTGLHKGKRHPTLGNGVLVGAGAKILGPFKVGDNAKIAAGAVVLEPIPENSTAVGVPARVVKRNGKKVNAEMDQIHIPDPISQEFCRIQKQLEEIEKKIKD